MKTVLFCAALLIPVSAYADGGFYGGFAEGMNRSQELRLQERALEVQRLQQEQRMLRQMEEQNRRLRELERERFERRYGPDPKPDRW